MLVYIIFGVIIYIVCLIVVHELNGKLQSKKTDMEIAMNTYVPKRLLSDNALYSAKDYVGEEHKWEPTHNLQHKGVRLFNLPFVPDENEIVYLENEYDADANRFVKENINLIRERLATRGLTFVYLPELKVSKEMQRSMIAYHAPQSMPDEEITVDDMAALPSNFLLDYMIHPENRHKIVPSFAWYGHKHVLLDCYKSWYYYNYITFDPKEALADPLGVIDDMLPELGTKKRFKEGMYSMVKPSEEDSDTADYNFDAETQKLLEDIQKQLDAIRLKGIGEAVIAKYVKPRPVLSHIRITHDFRIFLDDYNNMEIKMEPLVKAVYILFLRHEDGIAFKDLSDHGVELETIYRAIKQKRNDIDEKLASKTNTPSLSPNVQKLINPLDNSINEKCTRIKEAFIVHFHESIAQNYFILGGRQSNKQIILPRNLIIWEDKQ